MARFCSPPTTIATQAVAWLHTPPLTLERFPLAVFELPLPTKEAIPLANKVASIAVSHSGTYVLTEEDVSKL